MENWVNQTLSPFLSLSVPLSLPPTSSSLSLPHPFLSFPLSFFPLSLRSMKKQLLSS